MFIGREKELAILNDLYESRKSELLVVYGRRRIGKSSLIEHFIEPKPFKIKFEGIENSSKQKQIDYFVNIIEKVYKDKFIRHMKFNKWELVLDYFTEKIILKPNREEKLILFFDEIQWLSSNRSTFISLLKYYWDNYWKKHNVMVVLCGSIASFMIKKVIKSKALYGRISQEMLLKGLLPYESPLFFNKNRSNEEILKYMLIFGGVPRYLEEIYQNRSFNKNINRLCFSKGGFLTNEVEKIFYSQFKEVVTYEKIISILSSGLYTLQELANSLNKKSGGGLKYFLDQLENTELISSQVSIEKGLNAKGRKYRLADEFLIFHKKYITPNLELINNSNNQKELFEHITKDSLLIWLGFAFERFCFKHAFYIAEIMGFNQNVLKAAGYFSKNDKRAQIDLLFKRDDKVFVLCEVKYYQDEVTTKVISEIEKKIEAFPLPKGYSIEKALITTYGIDKHLKNSNYFDYVVTMEDILKRKS